MRVRIPSYSSAYHRGARTGVVLTTGRLVGMGPDRKGWLTIARVRLDGSGRTILIDLNDCQEIKEKTHAG